MISIRFAFSSLALAVIFGAFGAHILRDRLTSDSLSAWQTAVWYQLIHSLGILAICLLQSTPYQLGKFQNWVSSLFVIGIITFSGSIYMLSTQSIHGLNIQFLGPVTPLGGICFIAGWIISALSCGSKTKT